MKIHHHNGPIPAASNSRSVIHETIAIRAYELWEAYGRPDNMADAIWLEAECEQVTGRRRPMGSSPAGEPLVG